MNGYFRHAVLDIKDSSFVLRHLLCSSLFTQINLVYVNRTYFVVILINEDFISLLRPYMMIIFLCLLASSVATKGTELYVTVNMSAISYLLGLFPH